MYELGLVRILREKYMISGQCFKRSIFNNWPNGTCKVYHDSKKNKGSTLILTYLFEIHPQDMYTKYGANPRIGLLCQNVTLQLREVTNMLLDNDI